MQCSTRPIFVLTTLIIVLASVTQAYRKRRVTYNRPSGYSNSNYYTVPSTQTIGYNNGYNGGSIFNRNSYNNGNGYSNNRYITNGYNGRNGVRYGGRRGGYSRYNNYDDDDSYTGILGRIIYNSRNRLFGVERGYNPYGNGYESGSIFNNRNRNNGYNSYGAGSGYNNNGYNNYGSGSGYNNNIPYNNRNDDREDTYLVDY